MEQEKQEIELRCRTKAAELIHYYFPDIIYEATVERPETLDDRYYDNLPHVIENEFREWLASLWTEVAPEGVGSFEDIMNRHLKLWMVDSEHAPYLKEAREDAQRITLWEKLSRSNHEDVTRYKGMLKDYAEALLDTMVMDFIEEFR